eukprot:gnl/MRDRNA2_/MRDRNA2_116113_c0_seq1.p1 gnl/MRDRNA2_/MRDRNA2_116113_c0~~gnl/MRDRNA2_/MRDRNA2_116113_c0_seq1.p1  ORF type:complete len:188 (-),score=41.21 gnl/MRDRNA2_/MRDRNA2_116113_c0_seq1:38-601(-)
MEDGVASADAEIEEMQKKLLEMEDEAEKLRQLTKDTEAGSVGGDSSEADRRSIYVGNVDYGSTPEELQEHFQSCGAINRITIHVDKWTGQPKGYAYIEFADEQSVQNSLLLNESLFRGRQLKVIQKRTNIPGYGKGGPPGAPPAKGKGKKGGAPKGYGKAAYPPPWFKGGYPPYKGFKGYGKGYSPY